jgi:hypothetical protein
MKFILVLLLAAFALTAASTDISGKWKGTADTQMGSIERTFTFKVAGKTLSGDTESSMTGKSTIENGTIDADAISFTITATFQGNEAKINYTGKVKGDTIQLKAEIPSFSQSVEYTVHRVE